MGAATGGSGAPALEGYLYQVEVSVWTALDLVLAKKLANAVELEPCSQEDIEAHLPETDPGKVVSGQESWTFPPLMARLARKPRNRLCPCGGSSA